MLNVFTEISVYTMRTLGTVFHAVTAKLCHFPGKVLVDDKCQGVGVQGDTCLSCQWMPGWGSCWCWGQPWGASPPASLWRPASHTGPPLPAAKTSKTLQAVCAKPWLLQVQYPAPPPPPSLMHMHMHMPSPCFPLCMHLACMSLCACTTTHIGVLVACLPRIEHPSMSCPWVIFFG